MKKKLLAALLGAVISAGASAQVASATFGCTGTIPSVQVNFAPPDVGKPGLVWVGVVKPDQTDAYYLDTNRVWGQYQGGLYPPAGIYQSGIPGSFSVNVTLPAVGGQIQTNTSTVTGWYLVVASGAYTPKAAELVASRRKALDSVKAERMAAGKWNPEHDKDERYQWSLVQKDMTDGGKYVQVATIPLRDCAPPPMF